MKLYTEEQVSKIIFETKQWSNLSEDWLMASVTPIELPSGDEINRKLNEISWISPHYEKGFFDAIKWLKEQILNQKK